MVCGFGTLWFPHEGDCHYDYGVSHGILKIPKHQSKTLLTAWLGATHTIKDIKHQNENICSQLFFRDEGAWKFAMELRHKIAQVYKFQKVYKTVKHDVIDVRFLLHENDNTEHNGDNGLSFFASDLMLNELE